MQNIFVCFLKVENTRKKKCEPSSVHGERKSTILVSLFTLVCFSSYEVMFTDKSVRRNRLCYCVYNQCTLSVLQGRQVENSLAFTLCNSIGAFDVIPEREREKNARELDR